MKRKSYKLCLLIEIQIETTENNFCHLKCNCVVWYGMLMFYLPKMHIKCLTQKCFSRNYNTKLLYIVCLVLYV